MSSIPRYKLVFTVPPTHSEQCKAAIFAAGAGTYPGGNYTQVTFETRGTGQFMPSTTANPFLGSNDGNTLERVDELKIETLCVGTEVVKAAVAALKSAHPYEEPAYEVYWIQDF